MTGHKIYYRIPLLTKWFKIKFYVYWRSDDSDKMRLWSMGFNRDTMTLGDAIARLEAKRLWRESISNQ